MSTTPGIPYPSYSVITSLALGIQTVAGFDSPHDFTVGEIVSFRISPPFGTVQLNNQQARVVATSSLTITVEINSQNLPPFVNAGLFTQNQALVVPSGSGIIPGTATINLQDAFDMLPPT